MALQKDIILYIYILSEVFENELEECSFASQYFIQICSVDLIISFVALVQD